MAAAARASKSTFETRVSVPDRVLFRDLGTEAVILELETGQYYGLDGMGFRMWTQLRRLGSVESAFAALLEEFDVAADELRLDLLAFVDQLAARKLLELHDA